MVKNISIF